MSFGVFAFFVQETIYDTSELNNQTVLNLIIPMILIIKHNYSILGEDIERKSRLVLM